jgi:hypothetical protein
MEEAMAEEVAIGMNWVEEGNNIILYVFVDVVEGIALIPYASMC